LIFFAELFFLSKTPKLLLAWVELFGVCMQSLPLGIPNEEVGLIEVRYPDGSIGDSTPVFS
jgi:hypothetical protein